MMAKGITLQELDAVTVNRLIVKDASGRAKVAAPVVADDIALKSTVDNAVGTLSSLLTADKGNTVAAINELFTKVSNGKTSVAAAITGKGVAASGSDTFDALSQKIGMISTGVKFAKGQMSEGYPPSVIDITINNLDFEPTKVIVFIANYYRSNTTHWGVISNDLSLLPTAYTLDNAYPVRSPNFVISKSGFSFTGQFGYTSGATNYISWLAIE